MKEHEQHAIKTAKELGIKLSFYFQGMRKPYWHDRNVRAWIVRWTNEETGEYFSHAFYNSLQDAESNRNDIEPKYYDIFTCMISELSRGQNGFDNYIEDFYGWDTYHEMEHDDPSRHKTIRKTFTNMKKTYEEFNRVFGDDTLERLSDADIN